MFLKEISIFGFKSFSAKTVLKFEPPSIAGITCVVGPNGSGKSNVADAVRWVLGEQSNKLIRAKKAEDVIFFGSEKKQKSSYAEVVLLFDNSSGRFGIPHAEVALGRRLYRSGESEYLLNGHKARLFDIIEILAKAGIGQSAYTVVGQGMVDQVLTSNSIERKEFFDEAAGIKSYELSRDHSARRLELSKVNMSRIKDILGELSPRLTALSRAMEKQRERVEAESELKLKQLDYFSTLTSNYAVQKAEQVLKKEKISRELHELEEKVEIIKEEIASAVEAEPAQRFELNQKKSELKDLSKQREEVRDRLVLNESRLKIEKERSGFELRERYLSDLERIEKEEKDALVAVAEIEKSSETATAKKKELAQELEKKEKELASLQKEHVRKVKLVDPAEIAEKIIEIAELVENPRHPVTSSTAALRELAAELKSYNSADVKAVLASIDKAHLELKRLSSEFQLAEIELSRGEEKNLFLGERTTSLGASKKEIQKEIAGLRHEQGDFSEIEKQISAEKERLSKVNQNISKLEQEIETKDTEIRKSSSAGQEKQGILFECQRRHSVANQKLNEVEITLARLDTRAEDLNLEIAELDEKLQTELKSYKAPEIDNIKELKLAIERLKSRLMSLGGTDEATGEEFGEVSERHQFLSTQLADLEKASEGIRKAIAELDVLIADKFRDSFSKIDAEFRNFFVQLFGGGKAALLINEDPETKELGIEIAASPPGKKIQHLSTLSGGERTLTSIALIAAFLSINPSPFVILDEVDAALDELNTHRFLKILKVLSKNTQFITVTHNKETMKQSNVLYGVTMGDDHASRIISIKLAEAEEFAQA